MKLARELKKPKQSNVSSLGSSVDAAGENKFVAGRRSTSFCGMPSPSGGPIVCRRVLLSFISLLFSSPHFLCLLLINLANDRNFALIGYGLTIASSVVTVPIRGEREASANLRILRRHAEATQLSRQIRNTPSS